MKANGHILLVDLSGARREDMEVLMAVRTLGFGIALIAPALPKAYAAYIDWFGACDTTDESAVLRVAETAFDSVKISGVLPSLESNVSLVSRIAARCGLPGLPVTSVLNVRDKSCLRALGARNPCLALRHAVFADPRRVRDALATVGYPAIVKPTGGTGSVGVLLMRGERDASSLLDGFCAIGTGIESSDARLSFIAEEYVEGRELLIDGIVAQGEATIYGIGEKCPREGIYLDSSGVFPSRLEADALQEVHRCVAAILRDLELNDAPFHIDGKLSEAGFKVLDVGARPRRQYWVSHALRMSTGINVYEEAVKVSAGMAPRRDVRHGCVAAVRCLLAERKGVLKGYSNWEKAFEVPELEYAIPEVAIGSRVLLPPAGYHTQRLAYFIGRSSSYSRLSEAMDEVAGTVEPMIE